MARAQLRALLHHLRRLVGPQAGGLTDAHLLERFVNERDEAAFEVLVWRHGPMVLSVCRRVLRHEQDAEDAFQATFLTLVRRARSIGKRHAVASWLYKVAYRIALEAQALASKRRLREQQCTGPLEAKGTPHPGEATAWRDLRAVLDEEIHRLPDKYRTPLILCYFEGKTYEEVARELGCPKGTVSIRLMRARELLRPRLARRGLALSGSMFAVLLSENASPAAVSQALVKGTLQAALLFAAGKPAAGVLSGQAIALAEGVLKSMLMTKLKVAAAILLVVGVVGTGAGVLTYGGAPAEPTSPQTEKRSTPATVERPEQTAKPALRGRRDSEKTELEVDHTLNALQRAQSEASDLEHGYRDEESRWTEELIGYRLRLMEKEDQLKRLEQTEAAFRDRHYAVLKSLVEEIDRLRTAVNDKEHSPRSDSHVSEWAKRLQATEERLHATEEEFKKNERARTGQLKQARREFLEAEAQIKIVERLQTLRRDRMVRKLEAANERVLRLEEESRRSQPVKQGQWELEEKLDRLLHEMAELRREIRRQQAEKVQPQPPKRRPDQP